MPPTSLIPELEDVITHGTRAKRAEMLERITALFVHDSSRYSDAQVDLFDEVFSLLIAEIETKARAALALQLGAARQRARQSSADAGAR